MHRETDNDSAGSHDPKGLIRESYRIDGISDAECRSILIDWALSLPAGHDEAAALAALRARYAAGHADHPMSRLIEAALSGQSPPGRRRGGRAGRLAGRPVPRHGQGDDQGDGPGGAGTI